MENKFLIGNEIIETAIAAFTADPCEDTALAVVRTLQQYQFFYLGALLCSTPIFRAAKNRIDRYSKKLGTAIEFCSVFVYSFLLIWSVSYIMMGSHNPFIYFNF